MTPDPTARLRELMAKATPGRWLVDNEAPCSVIAATDDASVYVCGLGNPHNPTIAADAALIVAMRNALLDRLAAAELACELADSDLCHQTTESLEALQEALSAWRSHATGER